MQRMITIKAQEKAKKDEHNKNKNLSKRKGNGDKTKCKHCGNFHKGECCLKDTTNDLLKGGKGNPPKNKNGGNPKKNKKLKLADKLQQLTETIQSMNSQSNRPSWGRGMDANEFKAIQLSLAIDNSCTPDQVLNINIDSNDIARHKAAYKNCSD